MPIMFPLQLVVSQQQVLRKFPILFGVIQGFEGRLLSSFLRFLRVSIMWKFEFKLRILLRTKAIGFALASLFPHDQIM